MKLSRIPFGLAALSIVAAAQATTITLDIIRPKLASKSCDFQSSLPGPNGTTTDCTTTVTMTPKYKDGKVSEICVKLSVTCSGGSESETCPDPDGGAGEPSCFEPGESGAVSIECAGKTFTFGPGMGEDKWGDPIQLNWGDALKKCANIAGLVSS